MRRKLLLRIFLILMPFSLAACGTKVVDLSPEASETIAPTLPVTATLVAEAEMVPTKTPAPVSAAVLQSVPGSYQFAEGPTMDAAGNVFFSDINAGKIYRWALDGSVSVFLSGLNMPNGLAFDQGGNLIACEGGAGRLISIDMQGTITVLADQYNGVRFNEPNDLWIDPQGGIYFTDPAYQASLSQDGEDVYYLTPDHNQVARVIDDLVRPNGIVGSVDGKTLFVADHGVGKIYDYAIQSDGSLAEKKLVVAMGSDGMELDAAGNLYLTTNGAVRIVDGSGREIQVIQIPEEPTNVAFAGPDGNLLFITSRNAVYTFQLQANSEGTSSNGFTLSSPEVAEGGVLPAEYTCDGASATLALNWKGAPEGTVSYAVIMHHEASPEDIHWYWVLYDIPANVTSLEKNSSGVGILGTNSVNDRLGYAPPCSKGPGAKTYIYTVYALSAEPHISVPANQVTRAVLLEAIQDITLDSAELQVSYTRP